MSEPHDCHVELKVAKLSKYRSQYDSVPPQKKKNRKKKCSSAICFKSHSPESATWKCSHPGKHHLLIGQVRSSDGVSCWF